jgi:hypothetical protein
MIAITACSNSNLISMPALFLTHTDSYCLYFLNIDWNTSRHNALATFQGLLDFLNSLACAIAIIIQQVNRQLHVQTTANCGLPDCHLDVYLLPNNCLSVRGVLVNWLYCDVAV